MVLCFYPLIPSFGVQGRLNSEQYDPERGSLGCRTPALPGRAGWFEVLLEVIYPSFPYP